MKLSYIIEVDPAVNSGIIKKINNQVAVWKANGHQVQLLILWPRAAQHSVKFIEGTYFSNKYLDRFPPGFLTTYLTKISSIKRLSKRLKNFDPDLVYIRQNIWYPGLPSVLRSYKTVMELNSVDFLEMQFYGSLKKKVYLFGKGRLLKTLSGMVAVSPAILEYYKKYDIPKKVVTNGIDLSKYISAKSRSADAKVNLIFVGSANMYWHGLDKIFTLAEALPEYHFHIVGYDGKTNTNVPVNMKFHGWLSSTQLEQLYAQSNIGIGSFGNHHVGKDRDSTLKVIEYLAHGLPVILGHYDTDFNDSDFLFKITNEKHQLIAIEEIKKFIEINKTRRVQKEEIKKIDSKNKEAQRLGFFKEIITSSYS